MPEDDIPGSGREDHPRGEVAITYALREIKHILMAHVSEQKDLVTSIFQRFDRIEERHEKASQVSDERFRKIEGRHEREDAIKARDEARLIWIQRIVAVIGTVAAAGVFTLISRMHNIADILEKNYP